MYPFQFPKTQVMCLMFADDIVLLSTRKAGLQRQLKVLHTSCQEKDLQVNLQKNFTMSFGVNARSKKWKPLKYAGQPLPPQPKEKIPGDVLLYEQSIPASPQATPGEGKGQSLGHSSDHDKVLHDVHRGTTASIHSLHSGNRTLRS